MRYITLFVMILSLAALAANPTYYPLTSIAEDFGASWCNGCQQAFLGLDVMHSQTHYGEVISARLYTESGPLTNQDVLDRFDHYEVFGIPTVIFNGKGRVEGSDNQTASGIHYLNALKPFHHGASPIKIEILNFNHSSGLTNGKITVIDPDLYLDNSTLYLYLLENELNEQDNRIVRQILSQDLALDSSKSEIIFNAQFEIKPSYDPDKLWMAAFVQMDDDNIIQTGHNLPMPDYNVRAAINWDQNIIQEPSVSNFLSQPFAIFNLGLNDSFNARIEVDEAPMDWYFNYCDEEGNCFPGGFPMPLTLNTDGIKELHLNLSIGSSGIAQFRFVINSDNLGDYSIPFTYTTSDMVSTDDPIAPAFFTQLIKNYPNPFAGPTTLGIKSASGQSHAIIDIYNIKGQRVDSLHLSNLKAGENMITWNPASDLPPGIYFQKLRSSAQPAIKMLRERRL